MTTQKENDRLTNLERSVSTIKTDVALQKQFNEKVVEPALSGIQETLRNLAYLPITDFAAYKEEVDKKFKAMQRRSWKENTLSATFGAILTALLMIIVTNLLGDK